MPTIRNTLFHLHRQVDVSRMSTHNYLPMKMEQNVPKRRHINSRRRVITQKKAYNKLEFSRQIFEKYSNIKFQEYPSGGSRVVLCGQTDISDEVESRFAILLTLLT